MRKPFRLLLADDHLFLCELLRESLSAEWELEVVASVADADAALLETRVHRPDLAVLDIDMPGRPVFGIVAQLRAELPELKIVFLSAHASDCYIAQALGLQVQGYILKTEPLGGIVRAILAVARGGVYFSRSILERVVVDDGVVTLAPALRTRVSLLTPRESEVLQCVSRGLPKKRIAQDLSISIKTVEQHCCHIMDKLEIHDRVELARFAIREGLSTP